MTFPIQPYLLIYKRFGRRIKLQKAPFYIFGSSSAGNSVYLKPFNSLIDLGFPYSKYRNLSPNFFLHVKYIFLTHKHSDHFNPITCLHILHEFPNVRIILRPRMGKSIIEKYFTKRYKYSTYNYEEVLHRYRNRFINASRHLSLSNLNGNPFMFYPHTTSHGQITNLAIELKSQHYHLLYATDLDSIYKNPDMNTTGLPLNYNNPFNLIMLEANYNQNIVDPLFNGKRGQKMQKYAEQNKRHLSEQQSIKYANYMLSNNGLYVPLHASKNFGSYSQNTKSKEGLFK